MWIKGDFKYMSKENIKENNSSMGIDKGLNIIDEFIPNPDETGLLILAKMDGLYCYIGKDNKGLSTDEELELNSSYKHQDFDELIFFKNDHEGIIDKINTIKTKYSYVRLLDVVRDKDMFIIYNDLTDDYIRIGQINV